MADEEQSVELQSQEFNEPVESVPQEQFYREKSSPISGVVQKPSKIQILKDFITECKRVLMITKKPDKEELKTIVKISGLGILIIGLIGFLIHLIKEVLFK